MRIAIVGGGGVGGLAAGLLTRAGTEVALIARGAHLEAIRRDGLSVSSPLGTFTVRPASVTADPAAAGTADAVLVAVKAWQVAEVAPGLVPLLGTRGFAVPLQNGVEAADRLALALGEERVVGGLAHVLSWIDAPGKIRHVGPAPRITLGERRRGAGAGRLEPLAAALRAAGVDVRLVEDVAAALWEKFLLIGPLGAVAAAARAPAAVVRSVPETRALLARAMEEVAAVARARGVTIAPGAVEAALGFVDRAPADATASMQRDLGAGKPSELEDQAGAVVRLGRAAGVPTPVHETLYSALLPQERAARGAIPPFSRT